MDLQKFIEEFQDHLAPKLDAYEQAIYLYVFRHSRFLGKEDAVIGFKSARRKFALGIGEGGKPMSESSCSKKLNSLQSKGCIKKLDTERNGTRLKLFLPCEIPGVVAAKDSAKTLSLEEMDFFSVPDNRVLVLKREGGLCFYCLRKLTTSPSNHVIDHVKSRPEGDNSYRNLVAACRTCNNRKKEKRGSAEDFLRLLRRENRLNEEEFDARVQALGRLLRGELRPIL